MMFVAPLAGRTADRIGSRAVICGGLILATVGYGRLALPSRPGVAYPELIAPLVIASIGNSAAFYRAYRAHRQRLLAALEAPTLRPEEPDGVTVAFDPASTGATTDLDHGHSAGRQVHRMEPPDRGTGRWS